LLCNAPGIHVRLAIQLTGPLPRARKGRTGYTAGLVERSLKRLVA
jgi:hypothetical protein